MPPSLRLARPAHRKQRPARACLQLEGLETRTLPTVTAWPLGLQPTLEIEPNDVVTQANVLSIDWSLVKVDAPVQQAQTGAAGIVGNGSNPAVDVDWYQFTLDRTAQLDLTAFTAGGAVLSLYNSDSPGDASPLDHRLLAQAEAESGIVSLERPLAPGTYYVAVSGAGNRFFHPYLAGSGYPGSTGAYGLLLTATELQDADALPRVLAVDVLPASVASSATTIDRSPFLLRLDLSGDLSEEVLQDLDVQLTNTGDASGANLVAFSNFSTEAHELQLQLVAPLGPGTYQLNFRASSLSGVPVLQGDFQQTFTVTGVEGSQDAPDDTVGTAHELNLKDGELYQATGAIGDNPTSDMPFDANDVDVYHFQVSGAGRQALVVEAFAGRIGSPLNPALNLYQRQDDLLHLVAWNDDTFNGVIAASGSPVRFPLQTDAALYASLTEGDYYLAVSESGNQPDPWGGDLTFDPNAPLGQSFGMFGWTTGAYVLNVFLQNDDVPPQVVSVTPLQSGELAGPPTEFVVQFSEAVNVQQLAFQAQGSQLPAVYVEDSNGQQFLPRLVSYNEATNQATFLMLDRLAPDTYQLHLSGTTPDGAITDLAGNPLAGGAQTDANGDFALPFVVTGAGRGNRIDEEGNDENHPQDLGVLAPFELQQGIDIRGGFASEGADYYQLQVLQARQFILSLSAVPQENFLPPGVWLTITNAATGQQVGLITLGTPSRTSQVNPQGFVRVLGFLAPGATYVVRVQSWAPGVAYSLKMSNGNSGEAPPPLTVGPAPAIRLRLLNNGNPPELPSNFFNPPPPGVPGDLTSNGIVPARVPTNSQTTPPNGIPAEVLLALGTRPLGGPTDAGVNVPRSPDTFEQVFGRAPLGLLNDTLLNVTVLTQNLDTGAADTQENSTATGDDATRSVPHMNSPLWRWAIQYYLNLWMNQSISQSGEPHHGILEELGTAPLEEEDESVFLADSQEFACLRQTPATSIERTQALAITLLFATLGAAQDEEQRTKNKMQKKSVFVL